MPTQDKMHFDVDQFAHDIAFIRLTKGMSQNEVAKAIGVSKSTLNKVVNDNSFSVHTMAALCKWGDLDPNHYILHEINVQDGQ